LSWVRPPLVPPLFSIGTRTWRDSSPFFFGKV
jgi:hypothetical protein